MALSQAVLAGGTFLKQHIIPSGEVTLDISPILTAIHGKWHGLRFLSFGRELWCCLIKGQTFMNRKLVHQSGIMIEPNEPKEQIL